ncbi:MAG: surface protein [Flavipsychrobacter sp.]|nr:surface protein [Flavipsychrobacter sp.]
MRKPSLLLLSAITIGSSASARAVKIFLLAFIFSCVSYISYAAVTITKATGGTAVCYTTAVGGTSAGCTGLGPITIQEGLPGDFAAGPDVITLSVPAGWNFCTTALPAVTATFSGGGDVAAVSASYSGGNLIINISALGGALPDQITISNIFVQPTSTIPTPAYIYASSVTGVPSITTGPSGDNFGDLLVIPGAITGLSTHCAMDLPDNYSGGLVTGGTWSATNTTVAVDPAGNVTFKGISGLDTIIYTLSGCATSFVITVTKTPSPIVGVPDSTCAWFPSFYLYDKDSLGFFTSGAVSGALGGATVFSSPPLTGHATMQINAPGLDYVCFTLPSGCRTCDTFLVNPLPALITGNDTICADGFTLLGNTVGGGKWTSSNSLIATVDSITGLVTGVPPGGTPPGMVDTIFYTLPTGCKRDTLVIVNPLPALITGSAQLCVGGSATLTNTTIGGIWTTSNTNAIIVTSTPPTVQLQGMVVGLDTITYTITRTGCSTTLVVTVNPLPDTIIGNQKFECVGESIIQLSDATSGGTWSATNGNATVDGFGLVTGVTAGVDTISYTLSTGCGVQFVVTINPLPGPISGPDSFCVGDIGNYFNFTPVPASPVSWTVSPAGVVLGAPAGGVSVSLLGLPPGGVATVTYTLNTGCYTTKTITVNPLPGPITGPSVLCVGNTGTMSDASGGSVTWFSSNTSVATIDPVTGFVTAIALGTTIIGDSLSTGCKAFFSLTVTPSPTTPTGDSVLCVGDTATLYDYPAPGGTWTSTNTAVATIDPVTGHWTAISAGTSTITYTVTSSCFATTVVTVNPITPIFGPNTICVNDSIVLQDNTPGGTFTSPGIVTTLRGTVPGTPTSVVVVGGPGTGFETITYTTSSGCTATFIVTVYPVAPITGKDSVCVGDTIHLANAFSPTGRWSSSDTNVAQIDTLTGVVLGKASGTVLIIYTLPTGCKSFFTVRVNALPFPISSPSPTVCQGYTVSFGDASPGGTWSLVLPSFGSINPITGLYTSITDGIDTIRYTFPSGCKVSDTIRVFPLKPITGRDTICVGLTTVLSDATPGGTWNSDNPPVADITSPGGVVTGYGAGTATISYTTLEGCIAMDTIYVNPLPDAITGVDVVCVGSTTTFSDATPGGSWSSSNPGIGSIDPVTGVITGVAAGIATITYKLPTGCLITASVLVNPVPSVITGHSYVCTSFSTLLSDATPGGTWSVSRPAIGTIDPVTGLVTGITPVTDTMLVVYTLTATGCNAAITFTVFGQPPIVVSHPSLICRGASTTITAGGADLGTVLGSYTWEPATGLNTTAGAIVIASPTITTTYTVVGTTFFGCKDTVTTELLVDTLLNHLVVTGPDSICIGSCAQLIASGRDGSLFAWTPTTGLSCTICDTTTACPTSTTLYEATAIDRIGCKDSVAKRIVVMPLPMLDVYAEPHTFPIFQCRGTPLQLLAFGAWTYEWSPNLFLSCDSCANPVVNDTFNMQYLLTGHTRFGCTDSLKVKISVLDTNINVFGHDTDICFGDNAQLFASSHSTHSSLDIPKFQWYPSIFLDDATSSHPISIAPDASVVYTVVVTENICFSDTAVIKVNVQPYPTIDITPRSTNEFVGTNRLTTVLVRNTPVKSYAWTPGSTVSCDTCDTVTLTPIINPTTYTVTVTSIYGCVSTDTITVFIGCDARQVFIPNTFTPNGDGMNDRFLVSGKGLKTIDLFEVYNRWGERVYQIENISPNDPAAGWDGTYKGKVLEPDVFVYVVKATCALGGEKFVYKGDVSLVR